MKRIFIAVLFICSFLSLQAQNEVSIESLQLQLKNAPADSTRADILYQLSREYWDRDLDSSLVIANELLNFSDKIGFTRGMGNAYSSMGVAYWYKGDYANALKYNTLALETRIKTGHKQDIANSYNNIGLIYDDQGNYPLALEFYLKSLHVNESLNNKDGISQCYNNIGIIHYNQKHYKDALNNFEKSLAIRLETKDKWGLTESYSNIGLVYFEMKQYEQSFKNYQDAFKLRQEIDDREGISISYVNFGDYYLALNDYQEAIKYYDLALQINQQMGYRKKEGNLYLSMSDAFEKQGNQKAAFEVQLKALKILKEIGADDYLVTAYKKLSQSYAQQGDFQKAFQYHTLYKQINDSLFNSDRVRSLTRLQMQYDFDKKEAVAKAEQARKDELNMAELKRQKLIRYSVTAGLAGVFLFSLVVFRQRNKISKEKKRSDDLLLNILPEETAEELKSTGSVTAKNFDSVTVLFTDFKNFTKVSEKMNAQELVRTINHCYSEFDKIIARHGLEKIKTIGDSYMCAGGLPVPNKTHAEDAVKAAIEIREFMLTEKLKWEQSGKAFFETRMGIHTGCVVAGVVGIRKFAYDIWGDTVNIAARMESSGEPGKINISATTFNLIKDKFSFTSRGKVMAKNKGEIEMYFVD